MRVVVNNIAASSGGAMSILKSFYNYLRVADIGREHEWIFLLSDKHIEETDNIKVIVLDRFKKNWINRLKFDLYLGKKIISKLDPDIVFSLQNTITFGLKYPQVLYMHQSIPFQNMKKFSFFKSEERILAVYQYIIGQLIKESVKKADKIIVQTSWIKDAVIKATKIPSNDIIDVFPPQKEYKNIKIDKSFKRNEFFYPAADIKYKNHQCIFDACTFLNQRGVSDFQISLTIGDKLREDSLGGVNISYLGSIPFDLVLAKYQVSTLVFPSYIETVGLPLVEARQMGTIILASDSPFSREVLEGYENAYYFNPFKPKQLAQLMEEVITGKIKKKAVNNVLEKTNCGWRPIIDILIEKGRNSK